MSTPKTICDPKTVFEKTFGHSRRQALWSAGYFPAIPFSTQDFDLGAILPAMLYMMRWGTRRGRGQFAKTFGHPEKRNKRAAKESSVTHICDVVRYLTENKTDLEGFGDAIGQQMLGDLLLASCLENQFHAEGQDKPVQRVYPTHYMASWVDLPSSVSDLRGIPELLVAILVQQDKGTTLDPLTKRACYPLAQGFVDNELLRVFGRNMLVKGENRLDRGMADVFDEANADETGIDELLAIRVAQACKSAPEPAAKNFRGGETKEIPNQKPLPREATRRFRDDLRVLIEVYGGSIPRQAFLQLFEAAVSLNLTNLLLSTLAMLLHWEKTGNLPEIKGQKPWPLFVDCSNGQDKTLQAQSEYSFNEMIRHYEHFPVLTMLLRVLGEHLKERRGVTLPPSGPDATEFINFLGEFLHERHPKSDRLFDDVYKDCVNLANNLEKDEVGLDSVVHLRNQEMSEPLRFAESVVELMGRHLQGGRYKQVLESCLMPDKPNGLSRKRINFQMRDGKRSRIELSSLVLTPVMLDFLVHRHLHQAGLGNRPKFFLSLQAFLKILRDDYGLYIDQSPPGMTISQTYLDANARLLEHRLRDLGLLIGVNDAPSMKQLKARYPSRSEAVDVEE